MPGQFPTAVLSQAGTRTGWNRDETPPDWPFVQLVSFYVPLAETTLNTAGGQRLLPAEQTGVVGQEAMGTIDTMSIVFPGGSIDANGVYRNRFDGSWEQEFNTGFQALGTYTVQNNILTVVVTEPELAVSTTVWRRQ